MDLPDVMTIRSIDRSVDVHDLMVQAKKYLTSKQYIKQMRQIAKDLKAATDPLAQKEQVDNFNTLITGMVRGSFERTLVRIAVKGHLIDSEEERRRKYIKPGNQLEEVHITSNEIDNILRRYDAYVQFMDRAFADRLNRSLGALVHDFQRGSNSEGEISLSTKPFLTYLIALRSSGGNISADSDSSAPSVSSLQGIPDVIPNISVSQPESGSNTALLTVTHREGILLESPFDLAPRSDNVPDGVSNGLWYGFQDLAKFIMAYHLTGDPESPSRVSLINMIAMEFSSVILLKVINFFRAVNNEMTSDDYAGAVELIGSTSGELEVVLGANPEDELLDLQNRPPKLAERPLDLRAALHKVIVNLEKAEELEIGAYRFRKRTRSFAMTGTGQGNMVLLPVSIQARGGKLLLKSKYKDMRFEKTIRLVEVKSSVGMDENDPFFAFMQNKSIKKLSSKGIYELLHGLEFFKEFSVYEKTKMSEFASSFKVYRKGEIILRENSRDMAFFVMIKGHVRAHKGGHNLAKFAPGEMFGDVAFLTGTPQTMTIESLTNVLVMRVDQEMFTSLGPESREKFKNHIIKRQARSISDIIEQMQGGKGDKAAPPARPATPKQTPRDGDMADIAIDDAIAMINEVNFFDKFSAFEKRRIIALFTSFRTFPAKSPILLEGMSDSAFFIPMTGEVQVHKGDKVFVDLGPGEFFGGLAQMIDEPRTTSVRSKGEVLLLRLDPTIFEKLGPEIREKIKDQFIAKLTARLIKLSESLEKA